jgi:drug/metabolite transporter (DMT)-like permease
MLLGTIGVLVKLIGNSIPIMSLNFLRVFIGFISLLIIIPFIDKKWYIVTKKDIKEYFFIGLLYAISLSLYIIAVNFTTIQNAVLINHFYPFFVLIFSYFILKEKITRTKIITLIVAFIGLIIINPFKFGDGSLGNFFAILGAFFYGLLITKMRYESKNHSIGDVVWFLLFASLILLPFPIIEGFGDFSQVWVYVVLLGFVSTELAYIFYNLALEKIEAEIGAVTAMIITPLVSILLAVFIINENINTRIIFGGILLIIAGVYLEIHTNKKI